jgi:SAM-dependent methyltransferase
MFLVDQLSLLRQAELLAIRPLFPEGGRVLEIGAGTGQQSAELQEAGFDVTAIDIPDSDYAAKRIFPVIDYDGRNLPFRAASFDVVFSSNVLEHVRDLASLHTEIKRVLKPSGSCIHVLPTHAWRFWTMVTCYPAIWSYLRALLRAPSKRAFYEFARQVGVCVVHPRHGERGVGVLELLLFHPHWWLSHFQKNGFSVVCNRPVGLFYTGNLLLGQSLDLQKRATLARYLGSACHVYKVLPA